MKASTTRFILFLVMLFSFLLWLAFLASVVIYITQNPDSMDAVTGIMAGSGLGAVLGFFFTKLSDGWQFYFRKKGATEDTTTPPTTPPPTS